MPVLGASLGSSMAFPVVLAAVLVAYSTALSFARPSDAAYVAANLAFAATLLAIARRRGFSWADLGLSRDQVSAGMRWGSSAAVLVAMVLLAGVALQDRLPGIGEALSDQRARRLAVEGVVFQALVRIPLGTVVLEEVAFRGVLLAEMGGATTRWRGAWWSSVAFGLWHIGPILGTLEINDVMLTPGRVVTAVTLGVIATAVAGLILSWLRLASGSLLAPVLAHWFINALGLLAAWLTGRGASTGLPA